MKYNIIIFFLLIFFMSFSRTSYVAAQNPAQTACAATDTTCLLDRLEETAETVEQVHWRDSTYREMAKVLVHQDNITQAINIIDKISTPDTKAMTIRAIGTTAADIGGRSPAAYDALFDQLLAKAGAIEHLPSRAIALTYIAMAQAQAGDNDGAMATAAMMDNDALRNKAYAESAEIQAEKSDLAAVKASLSAMDDPAFRDKAYRTVSRIFSDQGDFDKALAAADNITLAYHKAQAYLYILVKQTTPEEVSIE